MQHLRRRAGSESGTGGFSVHIACAIDRLQNGEAMPEKGNRQGIISRNKRLYNDLREILSGLEETFDIRFSDDELAYMIAMVKKILSVCV